MNDFDHTLLPFHSVAGSRGTANVPRRRAWRLRIACALAVCGLLSWASVAHASAYQGNVSNVFALNGKVLIILSNGQYDGAQAACGGSATAVGYVADPSTPYGRTIVALALSAKLTGRVVWAGADGSCVSGNENLVNLDLKG